MHYYFTQIKAGLGCYPFIANKEIDGHQMTVVWHVKDLKISHKKPEEITKLAKYLSKISGDKSEQGNSS